MTPIRTAALTLTAALAAGCFAEGRCSRDDDCSAERFCEQGQCVARECSDYMGCATGQYCAHYRCQTAGAPAPEFALRDENPRSPSYGQDIGIGDYRGDVVFVYFAFAT